MTLSMYQDFIHKSRYARWNPLKHRREVSLGETATRYLDFMCDVQCAGKVSDEERAEMYEAIVGMHVMPSMRCFMTAGPALQNDHVAGYNCCYVSLDKVMRISEIMYILMCGTGVGFTVERRYISQLPKVPSDIRLDPSVVLVVEDSRIGWATACRELLDTAFEKGVICDVDYSKIRKAGTPLKVFGGRSAGPEPLRRFFEYVSQSLLAAAGRQWTSIEVHDVVCMLADIVVVGGVRRSALISLSDMDDDAMRHAKDGEWWVDHPYRSLANNSAVYDGKVTLDDFMQEMTALYKSRCGERGILNRNAMNRQVAHIETRYEDYVFHQTKSADPFAKLEVQDAVTGNTLWSIMTGDTLADVLRHVEASSAVPVRLVSLEQDGWQLDHYHDKHYVIPIVSDSTLKTLVSQCRARRVIGGVRYGTNPCSEIILQPQQFCNLTELVIRQDDTAESLRQYAAIATKLGTMQATLTDFRFLSPEWRENTVAEALLGVSLTGIMDNEMMYDISTAERREQLGSLLRELRRVTVDVNRIWADRLGIVRSAAITCIKPSGTVSQLVDSASGIHPRFAPYYIRTVRGSNMDPLTEFMKLAGVPHEPSVTDPNNTTVFSFPMRSPPHALTSDRLNALQHLELFLFYQTHYCEHKPSVTIYVREHEWFKVFDWVFEHLDQVSGIAFLPFSEHSYQQAPYQECTQEAYEAMQAAMPAAIDWTRLAALEKNDFTTSACELACTGNACEL